MKDLEFIKEQRAQAWREELRKQISAKDRGNIERISMPEQDPIERSKNYKEVNIGITKEQAIQESHRCLDCPNPTCMDGCPVGIYIPGFIKHIEKGDFLGAAKVIKQTSALPAVCGRVCPQEKQCEAQCTYLKMKKPAVAIGNLERFVADYERESGQMSLPEVAPKNGFKVAVIGSGPAGLACAGDLAKAGCDVTVFEALHEIGGVLKYGIPEFRLPNSIVDVEINNLEKIGVKFVKDFVVGNNATIDDLRAEGYNAFFVSSGAGLPRFMGIPGENYTGILSSNEYLTRVNLMGAAKPEFDTPTFFGKNVQSMLKLGRAQGVAMAAALYGAKVDMEAVDDTLATILVLRNDFIKRISHPEPGMEAKLFYKSIIKDFNLQVSDIIDKIGNLG